MRAYQESHPWITFKATDINKLGPVTWMALGEARSKCQHLAVAPLQPEVAQHLYEDALVKGAQATTAIEGNTLTEQQVAGIRDGTYRAPPSRQYQEREVRNVLAALGEIDQRIMDGERPLITRELICDFNHRILRDTDHEEDAIPGRIRHHSVGVPGYLGAPAEDCEYLLDTLAEWLEGDSFQSEDTEVLFALLIACAMYAHLYIAWLHPFGDGNGRTARLLEYLILARSGMVPLPAAHLLSNHYNLTRDRYYRELATASRTRNTAGFLDYATRGLVDGLRDQIDLVREQQFTVTWINYVHEVMGGFPPSRARTRQRSLVLAMPSGEEIPKNDLPLIDTALAVLYAGRGPRTLSRDLNRLRKAGLIVKGSKGWGLNDGVINAFLPLMADPDTSQ